MFSIFLKDFLILIETIVYDYLSKSHDAWQRNVNYTTLCHFRQVHICKQGIYSRILMYVSEDCCFTSFTDRHSINDESD